MATSSRPHRRPQRYLETAASPEEIALEIRHGALNPNWDIIGILDERGDGEERQYFVQWASSDDKRRWQPTWERKDCLDEVTLKNWESFKLLRPLYISPAPSGTLIVSQCCKFWPSCPQC